MKAAGSLSREEYVEAEADPTKEKQTPLDSGMGSEGPWGVLPTTGGETTDQECVDTRAPDKCSESLV